MEKAAGAEALKATQKYSAGDRKEADLAIAPFALGGQSLERGLFLLFKRLEFPALCPPTPCCSSLPVLELFCPSCTPSALPFGSAFCGVTCFCLLPPDGQLFYLPSRVSKSSFSLGVLLRENLKGHREPVDVAGIWEGSFLYRKPAWCLGYFSIFPAAQQPWPPGLLVSHAAETWAPGPCCRVKRCAQNSSSSVKNIHFILGDWTR